MHLTLLYSQTCFHFRPYNNIHFHPNSARFLGASRDFLKAYVCPPPFKSMHIIFSLLLQPALQNPCLLYHEQVHIFIWIWIPFFTAMRRDETNVMPYYFAWYFIVPFQFKIHRLTKSDIISLPSFFTLLRVFSTVTTQLQHNSTEKFNKGNVVFLSLSFSNLVNM